MSKWYLYENEEVIGPFTKNQLRDRVDEETLVCEAGEEDWQPAAEVPELDGLFASSSQKTPSRESVEESSDHTASGEVSPDTEEETIEPTLDSLQSICERAENDELLKQYEKHWEEYDPEERRVILGEIDNRGLLD